MSTIKNKVQLIGHLGMKPEIKEFESGKKMANFSMATSETYYTKNGEKTTDTTWHTIVCWGKQADIAEKYLEKGKEILVEGKIINDSWEDKEGNKRYFTKIVAHELLMIGKN